MKLFKLYFVAFLTIMIFLGSTNFVLSQTYTGDYFSVKAGVNNGIGFWGTTTSNNFKIHLDNTFAYGPVTDYSIRTNMSNTSGRGWTWGIANQIPVTAIGINGDFQTEGSIKSMNRNFYFGDNQRVFGDNNAYLEYYSNNSNWTGINFYDKEELFYGKIIGGAGGANFGLMDGDGDWCFKAVKDNFTAFHINDSEKMRIEDNGFVGIGTTNPQNKLDVCGTIRGKEVLVESSWCDYVFDADYSLKSIEDQLKFIEENGYLSNFESEEEMAGEINIGDVTKRQQKTIEEQMLYIGKLNDENKELKELVLGLVKDVETLKKQIQK